MVCILLSSGLSGTFQSAYAASQMCEYDEIYLVDSMTASGGMQILLNYACKLRDSGLSAPDIVAAVEALLAGGDAGAGAAVGADTNADAGGQAAASGAAADATEARAQASAANARTQAAADGAASTAAAQAAAGRAAGTTPEAQAGAAGSAGRGKGKLAASLIPIVLDPQEGEADGKKSKENAPERERNADPSRPTDQNDEKE